jgi:uncharacterized membrane protein
MPRGTASRQTLCVGLPGGVVHPMEPDHLLKSDLWLTSLAVWTVVALQVGLSNEFPAGLRWMAPAIEAALLIPLTVLTVRSQIIAVRAQSDEERATVARYRRLTVIVGTILLVIVSLAIATALVALIGALVAGKMQNGRTLLLDGVNIWSTNVIAFALWYWEVDRGAPWMGHTRRKPTEFIFAHASPGTVRTGMAPDFIDYLYLSFTTSTAFSPTDTLPVTHRMKLLMMLESVISLLTLALVTARAVNILA